MISLKSEFTRSFHDNGNMYKRQTLSVAKRKDECDLQTR